MLTANIQTITRLRINVDGEGVRSVVFMHHCPLRCFWCCNPETRTGEGYRTLTVRELYGYLKRDVPYFEKSRGGVVFSGGEPLLQADFLESFIREYGGKWNADIETSLYAKRETVERLIPLIHAWNVDFKVFDEALHRRYTGVSNVPIHENLRLLSQKAGRENVVITFPMIPEFNTSPEQIAQMTDFLNGLDLHKIALHPYRTVAGQKHVKAGMPAPGVRAMEKTDIESIRKQLTNGGFTLVDRPGVQGKDKCRYLKAIRKKIIAENNFDIPIADCPMEEPCMGTCPMCEHELEAIGRALQKRKGDLQA